MGEVTVTFKIEGDDPEHDMGVTEETYDTIRDALMSLGAYDLDLYNPEFTGSTRT